MKNGKIPDPNIIHPIAGYDHEIYVKPTIKNPNIIVGDFTIGKFCQIAAGVEFVMNGANHQMNTVTTYPVLHTGRLEHGSSCTI